MNFTVIHWIPFVLKVEREEWDYRSIINCLLSSLKWFFVATIKNLHSVNCPGWFWSLIQNYLSCIDIVSDQSTSMHQFNARLLDNGTSNSTVNHDSNLIVNIISQVTNGDGRCDGIVVSWNVVMWGRVILIVPSAAKYPILHFKSRLICVERFHVVKIETLEIDCDLFSLLIANRNRWKLDIPFDKRTVKVYTCCYISQIFESQSYLAH